MDANMIGSFTDIIATGVVSVILVLVRNYVSKSNTLQDLKITAEQEALLETLAKKAIRDSFVKLGVHAKKEDLISLSSELLNDEIDLSPNKLKSEDFDTESIIKRNYKGHLT